MRGAERRQAERRRSRARRLDPATTVMRRRPLLGPPSLCTKARCRLPGTRRSPPLDGGTRSRPGQGADKRKRAARDGADPLQPHGAESAATIRLAWAAPSSRAPPAIRIPRWMQLAGLPVLAAPRRGRWRARSRHAIFLFLDRRRDRVPAQPARAGIWRRPRAPRLRGRARVPLVRGWSVLALVALGTVVVDQAHSAVGPGRRLPYERERTDRPDGRRARHRPLPGLARRPRPASGPDREQRQRLARLPLRRRDIRLHAGRRLRSRRARRSRSSSFSSRSS